LTPPNILAAQLIGRDYLSYSAVRTYQTCSLKFYFQYIVELEPEFKSANLVFGGAIHAAIEHHFRRLFEGQPALQLDELLDEFEQAWKAESPGPIKFGKGESAESLRDLADRMLKAFQTDPVSKLDSSTTQLIGVEEELRAQVIPGCPDVLGRLDLVTVTAGASALQVLDFKTSRSKWGAPQVEEATPQQLLYAELVQPLARALGCRTVEIIWIVITKAKRPVVERHTLKPEPKQIARTKAVVRRVWNAIRGGHFFPSPSAMNCASCPYRKPCRTWEGG
jgi:putative RecB family exonuclease